MESRTGKAEVVITMEGKDAEEIRRRIIKENPKDLGVRVNKLIKTRRGLVVSMNNKGDVERMMTNGRLKEKGYIIAEGVRKRPMMMVYDIDRRMKEEEVMKEIYERNFAEGRSEQEFLRSVKVRRRIRQGQEGGERGREEKETWIMEVPGPVFQACMVGERVYVRWEALRIKEYIDVVRCFKCQGYGHIGKVCRERKMTCGRCAGDHKTETCKTEQEEVACQNCWKVGRAPDHPAYWRGCPIYKRAEERYLKAVDYES